ncbi:transcription intermediary factor 1-alpha-like isoform X2 [Haliotis asinina]|uniref:transcription intermediary factor 1-alpha-like isoform X2 n=1 Tax=Haliotis asinina TaxID=109174 RepID=UPI003531AA26
MDPFPKCSVCQQQFTLKGPAPYLLPCLHAVCETCVTSAAGGVISCSTCQREVNLTDTSLQRDGVRQKEIFHLTAKHRPTELLCTHEDDGNQAVCWCQECEELLCEYCQNMHNSFKATRRHVVETFTDTTPGSMYAESVCKLHDRYPLEYFDKNCNVLICAKCRLGEHADHNVTDLNVAADAAKGRVQEHQRNVSAYRISHQAYLTSISKAINDTKKTSSDLKEAIHYTFHSLRTQLDQREKELIIELENKTKQELSNLNTKQGTSEDKGTQAGGSHLVDPVSKNEHLEFLEVPDDPTTLPRFGARCETYRRETGTMTSMTLRCPQLQLDAARANTDWCHVTTDGELVNSPPASQHRHSGRLREYRGTCASTPILLPPSPSTVTPAPHNPQYWETQSRVGVVNEGWRCLVLEVGVVEESQVDSEVFVCRQRRSWCVSVWSCDTHLESLCTRVCQQREKGKCYSNTMSDTPGTQATLHYGVVLDVGRGRLAFIELDREVVLAKVDVEWRESLLPVFGVGRPGRNTVNMKVISGADITMTDTKKSLIYDALN